MDYFAMLSENKSLHYKSKWKDAKSSFRQDPRYQAVEHSSQREEWFQEHVKKLEKVWYIVKTILHSISTGLCVCMCIQDFVCILCVYVCIVGFRQCLDIVSLPPTSQEAPQLLYHSMSQYCLALFYIRVGDFVQGNLSCTTTTECPD